MDLQARQELEEIMQASKGILHPKDVVNFAKNKKTALHRFFEWDDNAAAAKYRLAQARSLIRVIVSVSPYSSENVKAFVSLTSDRYNQGGYRAMADIISDIDMKQVMLDDALKELRVFAAKYEHLRALAQLKPVFTSIKEVLEKDKIAI